MAGGVYPTSSEAVQGAAWMADNGGSVPRHRRMARHGTQELCREMRHGWMARHLRRRRVEVPGGLGCPGRVPSS